MNTSKIFGTVLIIASLAIGYIGINKISDNTKEINFLGLKINASNESGQQQGYIYLGIAIIIFAGAVYSTKSKS